MGNRKTRNDILSENILGYLQQNHLTQKEAATKAGLNYTTLNNWVKRISYPNEYNLNLLADVLDCSYADLTTEHSDQKWKYLSLTEQQILTVYRGNELFRRVVNQALDAYHNGTLLQCSDQLSSLK